MFQLCACHSDIPQYNSSETFRNVPLLLSHVCLCAVRFDGYIMLTLSVAVSLVAFPVAAVDYSDVVAPLYIGLEDVTADLAISSNGYANCSGSAYVANGYNATVVMELQQKNGTWKPIKRWSKSGGYVSMNESYRVSSKYYYRVAVTAKVYNSSGSLVESKTSYSGEVYY